MLSLTHARQEFDLFTKKFDITQPRIAIKIRHTYGVMDVCDHLAQNMHLSEEDYNLAMLIALLHDIGRFEQLARFDSYDDNLLPHAECGLEVLFDQGEIRKYIKTDQYDDIIYHAVKNHSLFAIDPTLSGKALFHAKLIRDADKLDNFRVRCEDSVSAILKVSPEELGKYEITDKVFDAFLTHKTILKSDRKTPMDMWITTLALVFDLNFPESFQYVLENDFIDRIIKRVPYTNPDTIEKMQKIRNIILEYIKK